MTHEVCWLSAGGVDLVDDGDVKIAGDLTELRIGNDKGEDDRELA